MSLGSSFGNLFGKSPIKPIQDHMAKAHACAEALIPFIEAAIAGDWDAAANCRMQIAVLEGEADDLKREVRLHLPKNLFLPVPRSDLLDMLTIQDRIANASKDVAGIMLGRKMHIPPALADSVLDFVKQSVATSGQALKAIEELDELVETGFSGRELGVVESLIKELDQLEHNCDQIEVSIRANLFAIEAELPPINVMFLYQVIDKIGELANRAQRVGSRLQLLIAR